jgi:hypothetical protein
MRSLRSETEWHVSRDRPAPVSMPQTVRFPDWARNHHQSDRNLLAAAPEHPIPAHVAGGALDIRSRQVRTVSARAFQPWPGIGVMRLSVAVVHAVAWTPPGRQDA